jgi:large subunit ribosomal protein L7/L12
MSQVTNEILEKLKTLTLLEATELVSKIEKTFGVDRSSSPIIPIIALDSTRAASSETRRAEKTTFDVTIESVRDDKRVAALKVIRSLTSLGLKEAKDFCSSLPKIVKRNVSKREAEDVKKRLEAVGGTASIK